MSTIRIEAAASAVKQHSTSSSYSMNLIATKVIMKAKARKGKAINGHCLPDGQVPALMTTSWAAMMYPVCSPPGSSKLTSHQRRSSTALLWEPSSCSCQLAPTPPHSRSSMPLGLWVQVAACSSTPVRTPPPPPPPPLVFSPTSQFIGWVI